jgi:thiamine pyrophosphokinase
MSIDRRAIIFANGELPVPEMISALISASDYLVCADGGLHHLLRSGLQPDLVAGDMDSISPDELRALEARGVRLARYPVTKDETDLELALRLVSEEGYKTIRIVAALGGRLDQTLGNIFLLARPELADVDIRLEDGHQEVFLIRSLGKVVGQPGDTISLIPLTAQVAGVVTEGLLYPLVDETLYFDRTRGISNVLLGSEAVILLQEGILLCIHERQPTMKSEI